MNKINKRKLLKVAYESRIEMTKSEINLIELREELSQKTGIDISEIYIDQPNSPNVPYSHIDETRPNEIFSFKEFKNGKKERVHLEDYSLFFNQFKGELKILRIYTWPKNRVILSKAAKEILNEKIYYI